MAPHEFVWALRLDLLFKLLLAVLLGGAIGLERELSGKPAGLRTNILICVGSALIMDLSMSLASGDLEVRPGDPGRIAAQVISGIGFIGAGTIMQARGTVIGLTTAATIWVVAAIGLTIGSGHVFEATAATVLVTVVLTVLGNIEYRLKRAKRRVSATIRASPGTPFEAIESTLQSTGIFVQSNRTYDHPEDRTFELRLVGPVRQYEEAESALLKRDDVISVSIG